MTAGSYELAVWSWSRHLATGGSTRWRDWLATGPATDSAAQQPVPAGWSPPGAAQLELLRRVAALDLPRSALGAVADLVTGRSGPGRGLGQQPLTWPGAPAPEHRFGAPAVDPSAVPAEELVRVGAGTLTELLLATSGPAADEPPRRSLPTRRLLTRSPAFVLAGAPVTTSAVRRALAGAGHLEGGLELARAPRVVLLAEPFDHALAQVWSARVQRGAPVRWHGFVARWAGRRELPPSMDLAALARHWAERVGADAVHLVIAPADPEAAGHAVAEALGVRRTLRPARRSAPEQAPEPAPEPGGCEDLAPAAVDVARRVNAVLGVRVDGDRHDVLLRRLVRLLGCSAGPSGHRLTVPVTAQDWARRRAERLAADLVAGGYPVHGPVEGVLPRVGTLATHPAREDALEVVVAACAELVRRSRPATGRELWAEER